MTLKGLAGRFPTEDACKQFLVKHRWPDGVVRCARCESDKVRPLSKRPYHWQCRQCSKTGYRFSVLAGTIFENTNVPLVLWFQVINLMLTAKKGVSAMQVRRLLAPVRGQEGAYRTAWYMCHRIRAAMDKNETFRKLTGYVEVDETYFGGSDRNRHKRKRKGEHGSKGKTAVIGAIARKGNVTCQVLDRVTGTKMDEFVRRTVSSKVSLVATDEHQGYARLHQLGYPHDTVNHTKGEYVRGNVHTAHLDSFWSLLKRGVMGQYHVVSRNYLPLYINEFAFRHNHRNDPDMFAKLIASC